MQGQKSQPLNLAGGWFRRELRFLGLFLGLISFSNLVLGNNTSALFVPILSASVDNSAISVNGNQVINSVNGTTELPLMVTVNTNNKTGYTAALSAETDNTALTNTSSVTGTKINSVSTNSTLDNLPDNTWGYKFGASSNYAPIPALSSPAQILQTAGKTNGNESNQLSIGMKLSENLESGNYTNKLVISIISNPYERRAVVKRGVDFSRSIDRMELNIGFEDGGWGKKKKSNTSMLVQLHRSWSLLMQEMLKIGMSLIMRLRYGMTQIIRRCITGRIRIKFI